MGRPQLQLTSKVFDRLTVIEHFGSNKHGMSLWKCKCVCGNETIVIGTALTKGSTRSCGCLHDESASHRFSKHRMTKTREYKSWASMIQRCTNPNDVAHANYGGRGITICDRWLEFENFFSDMGPRPKGRYSLGRINNNGPYTPDNCRWETDFEQIRNRRVTKLHEHDGETLCLMDWAVKTGIPLYKLRYYIERRGMALSAALAEIDPSAGRGQHWQTKRQVI